jgi:hypothetical protein
MLTSALRILDSDKSKIINVNYRCADEQAEQTEMVTSHLPESSYCRQLHKELIGTDNDRKGTAWLI